MLGRADSGFDSPDFIDINDNSIAKKRVKTSYATIITTDNDGKSLMSDHLNFKMTGEDLISDKSGSKKDS
jgi:hypothetical protein